MVVGVGVSVRRHWGWGADMSSLLMLGMGTGIVVVVFAQVAIVGGWLSSSSSLMVGCGHIINAGGGVVVIVRLFWTVPHRATESPA